MRVLLLDRISQTGRFSREDWILFIEQASFLPNPTITKPTAISWLNSKCSLNRIELKSLLESLLFTDGSQPTIILSQTGDILISE